MFVCFCYVKSWTVIICYLCDIQYVVFWNCYNRRHWNIIIRRCNYSALICYGVINCHITGFSVTWNCRNSIDVICCWAFFNTNVICYITKLIIIICTPWPYITIFTDYYCMVCTKCNISYTVNIFNVIILFVLQTCRNRCKFWYRFVCCSCSKFACYIVCTFSIICISTWYIHMTFTSDNSTVMFTGINCCYFICISVFIRYGCNCRCVNLNCVIYWVTVNIHTKLTVLIWTPCINAAVLCHSYHVVFADTYILNILQVYIIVRVIFTIIIFRIAFASDYLNWSCLICWCAVTKLAWFICTPCP